MPLAFALVTIGAIALYAGIKGLSIAEVFSGEKGSTLDPKGGTTAQSILASVPGADAPLLTEGPTSGSFDGHRVAGWIIPQLKYARKHGWHGRVQSGYRDPNQVVTPSPGLPVAPQGQSNHNSLVYPGGAVDVTDADGLERALMSYSGPHKLVRGTAIGDPIHFSATGN